MRPKGGPWRELAAIALLLAGAAALLVAGHAHYPVQEWLFWRYLAYWIICAVWAASCFSTGHWLVSKLGVRLPPRELCIISFASGVIVFYSVVFAVGIAGGLRPWFAVACPLGMLALGARPALRRVMQWVERPEPRSAPSRATLAAAAFGSLGLAMVYFTILTPENTGFDTQWYQLPMAEHYVAAGKIVPFMEGWYLGTYPHLANIVYTWAFLLPGTQMLDRVLLSAHLELVFFLATLASIPLLVKRLVRGAGPPSSWAAMFLFPCIFLYDGGLFVASDHVLAFFAIPVYLSLSRAAHQLTYRRFAVLAAMLSGALLTKYQAVYFLAPVVCVLCIAMYRASVRPGGSLRLGPPLLAVAIGVVLTSSHWLANWCWYGDPIYPFLYRHLAIHPWTPDTAAKLDVFYGAPWWHPQGTLGEKLLETARALVFFSFEPHDWGSYHGSLPIFGSLFTLFTVLLPFLRGARRIFHLVACTMLGVGVWYWTSHQDRYLQCLLPWMVVATASTAYLAWQQLPRARPAIALLVALQIVWGSDVYFIPANDESYEITRPSPIKAAVDLLSSGYRGDYESRLHPYPQWEAIGAALPKGAKVLLHERYLHLGIGAMTVSDIPGWQGGLSYESLDDSRKIYDRLSAMGVTHVLWETEVSHESASIASDLAFFEFAMHATEAPQRFGPFTLARMPSIAPEPRPRPRVAEYKCPDAAGRAGALGDPPSGVSWVVVDQSCHDPWTSDGYVRAASRGPYALFLRAGSRESEPRSDLSP